MISNNNTAPYVNNIQNYNEVRVNDNEELNNNIIGEGHNTMNNDNNRANFMSNNNLIVIPNSNNLGSKQHLMALLDLEGKFNSWILYTSQKNIYSQISQTDF